MFKKMFSLFFLIVLMFSCESDDVGSRESTKLEFYENSSIQISDDENIFITTIDTGDYLVFEYRFKNKGKEGIADSEFSEKIHFQIDPSLTEFSLSDDELIFIKSYYRKSCYCNNIESVLINSGNISGTKINDTSWLIAINVDVIFNEPQTLKNVEISGEFNLK